MTVTQTDVNKYIDYVIEDLISHGAFASPQAIYDHIKDHEMGEWNPDLYPRNQNLEIIYATQEDILRHSYDVIC